MTRIQSLTYASIFILLFSWSLPGWSQDAASPSDKQAEDAPSSESKEAKQDEVTLQGVFEATKISEIVLRPQEWSMLTVAESVEHGTQVDKGDTLLKLDREKIDTAIREAESALANEKLSLETAEIKFALARRSQALAMAATETAERVANEDFKEFVTSGRDRQVVSAKRSVQSAKDSLAYQQEELKQLERMYEADDLTEETEEIILKRTRDAVERAAYFLTTAVDSERRNLAFTIPRSEESMRVELKQATLALEEARKTAPISLKQQELAIKKQRKSLEDNTQKLKRLRADRKLLEIRSPRAGIVYYGGSKRGKWSDAATVGAMLQPGGTLKPKAVVMTVVQTSPLLVRVSVPETDLRFVRPGTKAVITPVAYPDEKLHGKVKSVSLIPISDGVFDGTLSVDLGESKGQIVPGMKAKVAISKEK